MDGTGGSAVDGVACYLHRMHSHLIRPATDQSFIQEGVDFLAEKIATSIEKRGRCLLGLSGGKTPVPIYRALSEAKNLDWSRVHVFLTDERYTASDSPESNQHMLREQLGSRIEDSPLVVPDTRLPIEDSIRDYALRLERLKNGQPADVTVLGMGEDGHIASLFPPLSDEGLYGPATVLHTTTDTLAIRDRISLSLPAIRDARAFVFLLTGEGKKRTWEEMEQSPADERRWPAKALLSHQDCTVFARW